MGKTYQDFLNEGFIAEDGLDADDFEHDAVKLTVGVDPPPPREDQCPNCLRDWHPGPLSENVARAWDTHKFENYNPDSDDSRMVCPGSDHFGPALPRCSTCSCSWCCFPSLIDGVLKTWPNPYLPESPVKKAYKQVSEFYDAMQALDWEVPSFKVELKTWNPPECETLDINVEFGPDNWVKKGEQSGETYEQARAALDASKVLPTSGRDFPVPESPGYDFSEYDQLVDDKGNKKYRNVRYKTKEIA